MSRHIDGFLLRHVVLVLAALPLVAPAQTIADYSRAQRAVLESTMAQAAARSAGLAASAPAVPALPTPSAPAVPVPALLPDPRAFAQAGAASVQVSGVFASAAGAVAEIDVEGTPYLLAAGQAVPGSGWRVESVAVDRVVLSRREPAGRVEPLRRVFALPPLR